MAKFQYKAKNMSGKIVEGIYEAPEKQHVIDMIKDKSFYPMEVKEIVESKDLSEYKAFSKVTTKDLIVFCKQFSGILKAGVSLVQALKMLGDQTENKPLQNVIKEVSADIQRGSSLSKSMAKHPDEFPTLLIHMIDAGEMSGTLENSLDQVAIQFEKQDNLRRKIKSAMTYPIVVLIIVVIVVGLLFAFVVPTFTGIFEDAGTELPGVTLALIAISSFLRNRGLVLILLAVIIGSIIKIYINTDEGRYKFDKLKLELPIFGSIQTKTVAASFARTLTTLMSSGVGITESIEITGQVIGNAYVVDELKKVEQQVNEGKGLYAPIKESGLFPELLNNMIMLGEETGELEDMLAKTATYLEQDVDEATQQLTTLVEPLIMCILAVVVGFVVIGIALPMMNMSNVVG